MRAPALVIVGLLLAVAVGDLVSQPFGNPTTPTASAAIGGILDDAGIGGDAGDTRATASTLSAFDSFTAGLENKDTDWYTYGPGATDGPGCVATTASGMRINDRLLEAGGATVTTTDIDTPLVLAFPSLDPIYLAFNQASSVSGTTAEYTFGTEHVVAATTDGKGGPPVTVSDPCTTGSVGDKGDHVDIYEVDAKAGDRLVLSLGAAADSDLRLTLLGKGKKTVESVGPGEPLAVNVDKDGTVRFAVSDVMGRSDGESSLEGTLLGSTLLEEGTEQAVNFPYVVGTCKPMCVLL